jgi:hypothetical protein
VGRRVPHRQVRFSLALPLGFGKQTKAEASVPGYVRGSLRHRKGGGGWFWHSPKVRSKAKREPSHVVELHTEPARDNLSILLHQLRQSKETAGDEGVYAIYI